MNRIKALILAIRMFGNEYSIQEDHEEYHSIYTWHEAWSKAKGVYGL